MRKFSILAALALVLGSCGAPANTPDAVVEQFVKKLGQMDFNGAAELATDDGKTMLQSMQGMMAMIPEDQKGDMSAQMAENAAKAFSIVSSEINGDTGTVTYKFGDDEQSIDVKQVNGQWKVDFKKDMGM